MKINNTTKKLFSMLVCVVLLVAMALSITGCTKTNTDQPASQPQQSQTADVVVKGEGQTVFSFTVVAKDGNETAFEIHTDKETVGEALLDCALIEGEAGQYGLYVKTVNGITADYDVDATYWAFYINDAYATSGVDTTSVTEGESYSFKVEK